MADGQGEKDWQKKVREFEKVKARAKALKLRLTCTICGEKAKLNCPCGTTQCAPAQRVGGGAWPKCATQVLYDRVPKNRLARPRTPEGVQEEPRRARGGGGAGGSADAAAVAAGGGRLRPRAAVARRRGPRAGP